jgi:hypothetical protein
MAVKSFLQAYSIYLYRSIARRFIMRKRHLIVIAALTLVAAVSLTSCGRHRGGHRRNPEVMLNRLDAKVRNLDLDESQQVRYEDLRGRLEVDLQRDLSVLHGTGDIIGRELNSENPDIEALAEELKARHGGASDVRGKYIDYFVEFYNILDEEQQEKVIRYMRRRVNRWHGAAA